MLGDLRNWRKAVILSGYAWAAGMTVVLIYIFVKAYLNNYETTVIINPYGEALLDLLLLVFACIFIFGGLFLMVQDLRRQKVC